MDYSTIAVRYAKSFFSLAGEKKQLEEVKNDLDLLLELLAGEELRLILDNSLIKAAKKKKMLQAALQGKINPISLNFLNLVIDNSRCAHFEDMCRYALQLYREKQKLKSVLLTTAVPMSQPIINQLIEKLEQELQVKVELKTKVDASLIGGAIIRIDKEEYNASVRHRLQLAKESMLQN